MTLPFNDPPAGLGQAIADLEDSIELFVVTPSFSGSPSVVTFTITDAQGLLTTSKMIRSVLGDGIDQWLTTNDAQLTTNGVTLRGSDGHPGTGDGFQDFDFNFGAKTAVTVSIVTASLTTAPINAEVPFADVV